MEQKPSLGRIVIFKLAAHMKGQRDIEPFANNGADECPAVVVRVWSDTCVNLKLLTDGAQTQWVTSASLGDGEGQWNWPARK